MDSRFGHFEEIQYYFFFLVIMLYLAVFQMCGLAFATSCIDIGLGVHQWRGFIENLE